MFSFYDYDGLLHVLPLAVHLNFLFDGQVERKDFSVHPSPFGMGLRTRVVGTGLDNKSK